MKLPVKYDRRHTGTCILIDADGAEICSFGYDDAAKSDAIKVAAKLNSHAALVSALEECKHWHQGDKWRHSDDPEQKGAWNRHMQMIDSSLALAKGE